MTMSTDTEIEHTKREVAERLERIQTYISVLQERVDAKAANNETFEELSLALEELRTAEEEIISQNEELREALGALERERGRYADLFEFAPDAYFVTDSRGMVQQANRAAAELLGVASRFLPGKPLVSYLDDEGRKTFRRTLAKLTSGEAVGAWEVTLTTRHEASNPVAEVKVTVDRDEGEDDAPEEVTLRWVFRDITERVAMRDALHRSQLRFRQAFRIGPVAAIITSLDNEQLLEVNSAFERLTGYSADEALGATSHELGLWASAEDQAAIRRACDESGAYREVELRVRTKHGEVRNILSSTEVIALNGHNGMLHMFYDITKRKQNEEELMQAINTVMQDTAWFSRSVVEKLTQLRAGELDPKVTSELTKRERQVLERVAQGHSNEAIAEDLGIAKQTVRNYVTRVYEKLGVHTRAEAVVWARERGLSG